MYAATPLGLSVEVNEIDDTAAFRKNNLHERMAAKTGVGQAPAVELTPR